MSKKIQTDELANELAAGSLFFGPNARPVTSDSDGTPASTPLPTEATPRRTARKAASFPASTPASSRDSARASTAASTSASTIASSGASISDSSPASTPDSTAASGKARTPASQPASPQASTPTDSLAHELATSGDLVDAIYRVVKKPGKQTNYVRVTAREKSELAAVLAGISEDHGYKVTETELIRTAICSALADYAENGMDSLLMRVIIALRD
jgi:hypothetical protein